MLKRTGRAHQKAAQDTLRGTDAVKQRRRTLSVPAAKAELAYQVARYRIACEQAALMGAAMERNARVKAAWDARLSGRAADVDSAVAVLDRSIRADERRRLARRAGK